MKPDCLLAGLAWALDSVVMLLMLHAAGGMELLGCAVLHLGACLLFAQGFADGLLQAQGVRRQQAAVLGFVLSCVLPVLGMMGMLLLVTPALTRHTGPTSATLWRQIPALELPARAPPGNAADALAGSRNLDAILHNAPRPPDRAAALMGTLRLPDVQGAALLRKALKDRNEEVRLLAYALLSRKEKAVEARIHGLRQTLSRAAPEECFAQHRALAHAYWELYLLGAQHAASASHVLAYVEEHAHIALAHQPEDAGLQFLLGRTLLRQERWDQAEQTFRNAERAGMAPRRLLAYRAEIEFRLGTGRSSVHPVPEMFYAKPSGHQHEEDQDHGTAYA